MTTQQTKLVVLGSGPGGYTAAFRAADLGIPTVLVERYENIGGVCLNVGCIPSKALLHVAKVIDEVAAVSQHGVEFGAPKIDLPKILAWKNSVVGKLTGGLKMLAKQRKVEILTGVGKFIGPKQLEVTAKDGSKTTVEFEQAIIAAGSQAVKLPFIPNDPRVLDSTSALMLEKCEGEMLVLGGGIIGLEMATVYEALGATVTVVEFMDQLMPGVDPDIIKPYMKRVSKRYKSIMLKTKVTAVEAKPDGMYVTFEGEQAPAGPQRFDRILVAVGRKPNGKTIGAEAAGVTVDERGFIPVDKQMRTNVPHIFAIGDIVGQPMLAHKALHEAKVAAEVASGLKHFFDPRCIPSVAYTDPEVAWVGLTESEAKRQGIAYRTGVFPWAASGRSLAMGRDEGLTKVIIDEASERVLGVAIIGPNAGDLISEGALAIEMGCDVADIALTIHPHPTLSETIAGAAEMIEGTVTDLYIPKRPAKVEQK
jgi:dihydrolipoamide dehydrogenase